MSLESERLSSDYFPAVLASIIERTPPDLRPEMQLLLAEQRYAMMNSFRTCLSEAREVKTIQSPDILTAYILAPRVEVLRTERLRWERILFDAVGLPAVASQGASNVPAPLP